MKLVNSLAVVYLVTLAAAVIACTTTPADRVRYGIAAIEMACEVAEKRPADVPAEVKERLDPLCLALEPERAGEE